MKAGSDPAQALAAWCGAVPRSGKAGWLRTQLTAALRRGVVTAGDTLPGARDLATALGVARGTVDECYARLADEGFVVIAPRRRPIVVAGDGAAAPSPAAPTSAAPPPTPGIPDARQFPHRAWAAATRTALARLAAADLGYPDPSGHPLLRAALSRWLARTRGVVADADDIHITGGVSHAVWLLAHALDAHDWAIESPGSAGSTHLLSRLRRIHPVPVDASGLIAEAIPAPVGAVLLTPTHQYPTGITMPPDRRRAVLDACRTSGSWVVEDDYDSHLAARGVAPSAMQALAPASVVLVGSLSKILAPALRLGWVVAPPAVTDRLRELRQESDLGVSVPTQLAAAEFVGSGEIDRHLRRVRVEYARRRAGLASLLTPRWSVSGAPIGVHAFVPAVDPSLLVAHLAGQGIPSAPVIDERHPGAVVSVAACPPE